jgi:hypothetical protein
MLTLGALGVRRAVGALSAVWGRDGGWVWVGMRLVGVGGGGGGGAVALGRRGGAPECKRCGTTARASIVAGVQK